MPYRMNQAQFDKVQSLTAEDRYKHFVSKVADWQELWSLKDFEGFAVFQNDVEQFCLPFWPHPDYAAALAVDSWSEHHPERIDLETFIVKWIAGMKKDGHMAVIFPTPHLKGVVVDPDQLKNDLTAELAQYE